MSKQNMYCGLRRSNNNRPKVSDGRKDFLSRKSLEQNLKDCEAAYVILGHPDLRHSTVTFLSFGLDGHWRLHALPFLCPDNSNILGSGAQAKMGDCILVSTPFDSFRADQHKESIGSLSDGSCSVKSLTDLSFSQSKVNHQSRSKSLTVKAISLDQFSECDTAGMISDDSGAINSSEASVDSSKEQKNAKKNARRNARKKAKRKNKLSSDTGSTELEVLSEECTLGSSTSEASINNDINHGDGTVLGDSTPVNSLLDCPISVSDSVGDSNGMNNCLETSRTCTNNCLETSRTCTSYIDGMDESEDTNTSIIHNFSDEHSVINSEDGIQTKDMGFSISKGLEDMNGETIHSCDNMSFKYFSDGADSLVFGSVPVGYSCEDSTNAGSDNSICAGYKLSPSNEEGNGIRDSETHQSTRNECFAHQSAKNCAVDSCNSADRMKLHSVGHSSSDTQLDVHGHRDKQTKMVVENAHGFVGKENVNCLQPDKTSKEALLLKRNCNNVEARTASKSEDKNQRKVKVQRKSKKKKNLGSKQDYHCYPMKRSHSMKASSDAPARINIEENEMSVFPVLSNGQNGIGNVSQCCSQNDFPEPELQIKGVETMASELVHRLQDCIGSLEPPERHGTISNIKNHLTKSLDNLGMSNPCERQSAVHRHPFIGEEVAQVDKEVYLSENSKQEHSSALVMKKWRPVVRKDSGFASVDRSDISLLPHADSLTDEGWTPKNSVEEILPSVSSNESEVMCVDHSSENANCFYPKDKSPVQSTCMPKTLNGKHFSVNCFTQACKEKHIFAFGADSSKISGALHDVHRVQQLSESVRLATGSPIADFERLLHAASPVICHSNNDKICQNCLQGEVDGPLCQHEAPNVTLKSLWKWYKKHGNYGLEVRLEDCDYSKRLYSHHSAFQAYFVPSLSAVQLFKKRKSHCVNNGPGISKAGGMSKISQSSFDIGHHPIISIPVPRAHTEYTSLSPLRNQVQSSQVSSMAQSVDATITDDSELLFEYFESDQPQLRKPLFEKIKELVRGDGPSSNKVYGDPTKLDSMNLNELHHNSWFSVAWYPIYRIPDGEFRAAFLTYHSFGHLIHRSSTFDSHRKDACIVSPVVGLQSYNAQREWWFHLKQFMLRQTEGTPNLKPAEILRERLKTLEQAASVMARAEVRKGNLKSVNRHPDYEFFLSRQRW